uniref:DUF676 domain-containing protein n=1 Tax=Ananas comosus var. bracteatus TaxID=296719 RepID=A0A6V7NIS6_ANACO|nr:unnamed protein product [Ananas comosus var. bracteatus]
MGNVGEVRTEETANGGTDAWSSSECAASKADHLVVMVHGILGSTSDWKFGAEQFVKMLPDKVIVHCSERNMNRLTLDGVDVMGERLAEEVIEVINRRPQIRKISFVAHSVGGLVARYAIAVNFITVATPHLGSRGNKQVPFLFGLTAMENFASRVIHWIFRRTGKHLFLTDNDEGKPPLLRRMLDDCGDLFFMSALQAFKRRVLYANVGHDHIVGWRTSSIRRNSELPTWEDSPNKIYPHVVHEELVKGENPENCTEDAVSNGDFDMLEEELVTGLRRLSWERVDVSFHTSMQRFAAHSLIQVKDSFMHSEGADVIQHIIDHFLL